MTSVRGESLDASHGFKYGLPSSLRAIKQLSVFGNISSFGGLWVKVSFFFCGENNKDVNV